VAAISSVGDDALDRSMALPMSASISGMTVASVWAFPGSTSKFFTGDKVPLFQVGMGRVLLVNDGLLLRTDVVVLRHHIPLLEFVHIHGIERG
jgi:hypothetical protein